MIRRNVIRSIGLLAMAALLASSLVAQAHHGWAWATDETFELTGSVKDVNLGNPHGEVTLDADGQEWTVEVGQPWRNERAGLTRETLAPGTEITVQGHRSANESEYLVKAEQVVIAGENYVLYPDRVS